MRSLIIYALLGLIAATLIILVVSRITTKVGQDLIQLQEQRIQAWEKIVE